MFKSVSHVTPIEPDGSSLYLYFLRQVRVTLGRGFLALFTDRPLPYFREFEIDNSLNFVLDQEGPVEFNAV